MRLAAVADAVLAFGNWQLATGVAGVGDWR